MFLFVLRFCVRSTRVGPQTEFVNKNYTSVRPRTTYFVCEFATVSQFYLAGAAATIATEIVNVSFSPSQTEY